MAVLTSIYIITFEGVSPFITILSLSFIRLLIGYGGRDGLGPGIINNFDIYDSSINGFGIYNPGVCGFIS